MANVSNIFSNCMFYQEIVFKQELSKPEYEYEI